MPRILPLLAATAVLACGDDVSGNYNLVSVNGVELPYTEGPVSFLWDSLTIVSSSLNLMSSGTIAFSLTLTFYDADGLTDTTYTSSGMFTVEGSNIIRLTFDDDDLEGGLGRLNGDQITIIDDEEGDTLVYRR